MELELKQDDDSLYYILRAVTPAVVQTLMKNPKAAFIFFVLLNCNINTARPRSTLYRILRPSESHEILLEMCNLSYPYLYCIVKTSCSWTIKGNDLGSYKTLKHLKIFFFYSVWCPTGEFYHFSDHNSPTDLRCIEPEKVSHIAVTWKSFCKLQHCAGVFTKSKGVQKVSVKLCSKSYIFCFILLYTMLGRYKNIAIRTFLWENGTLYTFLFLRNQKTEKNSICHGSHRKSVTVWTNEVNTEISWGQEGYSAELWYQTVQ